MREYTTRDLDVLGNLGHPGPDGPQDGPPSPPYNMGLPDMGSKLFFTSDRLSCSLSVDKLRLRAFVRTQDATKLVESAYGLAWGPKRYQTRRRGSLTCEVLKAGLFHRERGQEGYCHLELRLNASAFGSDELIVEYNPNKVSRLHQAGLGSWLTEATSQPVGRMIVDRFDAAFDYRGPREAFVLDDPLRKADLFGVDASGVETARTGYRKGSKTRHQLYDKTAERKAKGSDAQADLTRYEIAIDKPDPDQDGFGVRLDDLGNLAYPDNRVTLRHLTWKHGELLPNPLGAMTHLAIKRGGIREAWKVLRGSFNDPKAEHFMECICPPVNESPQDAWTRWPEAVALVSGHLQGKTLAA